MWCSFVKAKRSPPITWGISWATWLRVRVAFFTITKKIIIFYSTNLITQLITGSRRSYRRFFGQYQAFIRQKGRRENKPHKIGCAWCQGGVGSLCAFFAWVSRSRSLHITVLELDTGERFLSQSSNVKVQTTKKKTKLLSIFTDVRNSALD